MSIHKLMVFIAAILLSVRPLPAQTMQEAGVVAGVNIGVSSLVAGTVNAIRGESFWHGTLRGAEAGAVHFAGKWIASRRHFTAQIPGRLVGQLGASMLRNSIHGEDRFERLTFGIGPFWFDIDDKVTPRLDVITTVGIIEMVVDDSFVFDPASSVRHLAASFQADRAKTSDIPGLVIAYAGVRYGSLWTTHRPSHLVSLHLHSHEAVHLIQHDMNTIVLSQPTTDAICNTLLGSNVCKHVSWNVGNRPFYALRHITGNDRSLSEDEAHVFVGTYQRHPE